MKKYTYVGRDSKGAIALTKDVIYADHWAIPYGSKAAINQLCNSYNELGMCGYDAKKITMDKLVQIAPTIHSIGSVQEGASDLCVIGLVHITKAHTDTVTKLTCLTIVDREFVWMVIPDPVTEKFYEINSC